MSDISKSIKWYSWCDEAFAKAKDENKAIFISIIYPLCHWCDMMERDVFSNEECIEILDKNQLYVNLSSLNDKDFECTEEEKQVTKDFYQIKG